MRFFTPSVCDSLDSFESFKKVEKEYRTHLSTLRGILPERVLELAEPSGMEDGLIASVQHDREMRKLRIMMRCGHLQMGYYNLSLTYDGAELQPKDDLALAAIARSTKAQSFFGCDLAYHELDAAPGGGIEHSFIFHANAWHHPKTNGTISFTVRCQELRWHREPKKSRRLPPSLDRYPGGPGD